MGIWYEEVSCPGFGPWQTSWIELHQAGFVRGFFVNGAPSQLLEGIVIRSQGNELVRIPSSVDMQTGERMSAFQVMRLARMLDGSGLARTPFIGLRELGIRPVSTAYLQIGLTWYGNVSGDEFKRSVSLLVLKDSNPEGGFQ